MHCAFRLLLALIFAVSSIHSIAQEQLNNLKLFTAEDGLNDPNIRAITQDKNGVLWIGTSNGLNRFVNGKFRLFHEYTKPVSLSGHSISSLYTDSKNRIWVGDHLQGITVISSERQSSTKFSNQGVDRKFSGKEVYNFKEDSKGNVWAMVFPNQVIKFSSNLDDLETFHIKPEIRQADVQDFCDFEVINDSIIYFLRIFKGVYSLNVKDGSIEPVEWINDQIGFLSWMYIGSIKLVGFDQLFIQCSQNHIQISLEKKRVVFQCDTVIRVPSASNILVDNKGNVLLANYPQLQTADIATGKHTILKISNSMLNRIGPLVHKIHFLDRNQILWVGTNRGLLKIDLNNQQFKCARGSNFYLKEGGNYMRAIVPAKNGDLLFCTVGERCIERWTKGESGELKFKKKYCRVGPQITRFNNLIEFDDGSIMLCSYSGLYHVRPGSDRIEHLSPKSSDEDSLHIKNGWSFFRIDDDKLLIGVRHGGVFCYSRRSQEFKRVTIVNNSEWPENNSVWIMKTDSKGRLWLCTAYGLFYAHGISEDELKVEKIKPTKDYSIWSFCETNEGEIWVGTAESGVFCLSPEGHLIQNIGFESGVRTMSINSLQKDKFGRVWASSILGMHCFDPSSKKMLRSFGSNYGLLQHQFNFRSSNIGSDGTLYFGTKDGVVYFDPGFVQSTYSNSVAPRLIWNSINSIQGVNGTKNQEIVLVAQSRNFSIEPALTEYINPTEHQYFYKLEGIDKEWQMITGTEPRINYFGLPAGRYQLVIKAKGATGMESGNVLKLGVVAKPFWWETMIAKLFFILTLVLALLWVIRGRLRSSKLESQLLQSEVDSMRTQMNPHFFFNALNSIQSFIIQNNKEKAANYLASFAQMLRSILENSNKHFHTLSDEIDFLKRYLELESMRFEGLLKYEIELKPATLDRSILVPTMLVQPLVENAIKHGLAPKKNDMKLMLRFYTNEKGIYCDIEDNGVGRRVAVNPNHKSRGLGIVGKRLDILTRINKVNYQMEIFDLTEDGQPIGTKVCLKLK